MCRLVRINVCLHGHSDPPLRSLCSFLLFLSVSYTLLSAFFCLSPVRRVEARTLRLLSSSYPSSTFLSPLSQSGIHCPQCCLFGGQRARLGLRADRPGICRVCHLRAVAVGVDRPRPRLQRLLGAFRPADLCGLREPVQRSLQGVIPLWNGFFFFINRLLGVSLPYLAGRDARLPGHWAVCL